MAVGDDHNRRQMMQNTVASMRISKVESIQKGGVKERKGEWAPGYEISVKHCKRSHVSRKLVTSCSYC